MNDALIIECVRSHYPGEVSVSQIAEDLGIRYDMSMVPLLRRSLERLAETGVIASHRCEAVRFFRFIPEEAD